MGSNFACLEPPGRIGIVPKFNQQSAVVYQHATHIRCAPVTTNLTPRHAILAQAFFPSSLCSRVRVGFVRCKVLSFVALVSRTQFMPRRGWSSIATPSGWYEVIRESRPPSVQWPLAPKGQGKGKGGKPVAAPRAPQKTPQKAQSKVGRLEAALQALGQEQSSARSALEEALDSEGGISKGSAPTAKSGRSVRTCGETRGGVETFGRGRPRCRTFEDCIETAEESSSSASSWGAPRSVPPKNRTSEKTSSQGRGARPRSQGSPGSDGGEVGQWVARFVGPPCRSVGRASTAPPTECPTTRDGGGTQRGDRQVASSGRRAPEGTGARGGGQSNEESKNIGRELHRSCALSRWTQ